MRTSSPYWCYRYLSLMWSVQEGYLPSSFFFPLEQLLWQPYKMPNNSAFWFGHLFREVTRLQKHLASLLDLALS